MRLAVLLHGQPRHLEQGAWWFKNRVFPEHFKHIQVDYYCCFWHDSTPDLEQRVQDAYNPVQMSFHHYDEHINKFIEDVQYENKHCGEKQLLPQQIKTNVLLDVDKHHMSSFARNFWGQFLSCDLMTKMVGDLSGKYEVVCRTRSDIAFNPMGEEHWMRAFHNMYKNNIFDDKLLSDWLYVKSGNAYVGDFAFWGKPATWYNYTKDFYNNCVKLATVDKLMWYGCHLEYEMPFPHKTWMYLSQYSYTDWLSFAVVWPTPYASTLIRQPLDMSQETYQSLATKFAQHG